MTKKNLPRSVCKILLGCLFASGQVMIAHDCYAASQSPDGSHDDPNSLFSLRGDFRELATYTELGDWSDSDFSSRLRLQVEARPVRDLKVVARIKATRYFDADYSEKDDFMVDRLYLNWENIGNLPVHILAGRLPTMGEPGPAHFRLGLDAPGGSLGAFTDIAVDGIALGYDSQRSFPGTISFYYGTQIEEGYESRENNSIVGDSDIYGLRWDILQGEKRSLSLQALLFADLWNIPEHVAFPNLLEIFGNRGNGVLDRETLGDVYHTSFTYVDRFRDVDLFLSAAWSHSDPDGTDELGNSLFSDFWDTPENEDGFSVYTGIRYNVPGLKSKIGLEYNYGSRYWISFSQDLETEKLATRGSVAEVYGLTSLPLPSPVGKYLDSLTARIGYQYYWLEYTWSSLILGDPRDLDDYNQIFDIYPKHADLIYAAIDIYF